MLACPSPPVACKQRHEDSESRPEPLRPVAEKDFHAIAVTCCLGFYLLIV
jgi:hypothetical protein